MSARAPLTSPAVRRPRAALSAACAAGALALLAGCGPDMQELESFINSEKAAKKASVKPLEPPKKFDPQAYQMAEQVDPFSSQKLSVAIKQEARQPSSLLATELNRRKEPLESYPLDSMSMVGSVTKQGRPYALLKVDNLLYQVKPGDYLGQNYGRITRIAETEIALREIVQDAAGEWIERTTSLQLQEQAR